MRSSQRSKLVTTEKKSCELVLTTKLELLGTLSSIMNPLHQLHVSINLRKIPQFLSHKQNLQSFFQADRNWKIVETMMTDDNVKILLEAQLLTSIDLALSKILYLCFQVVYFVHILSYFTRISIFCCYF